MGDNSAIEWTDATWNVITGCSVVSPGCTNCYAMRQAGTRLAHTPSYQGLTEDTKAGPVWNGKVRFNEKQWELPLKWKRPRRIFVNSMGDLFHENVPDAWIDRVFAVMALAYWHVFQVLTKRADRMQAYCEQWPKHGNSELRSVFWPLPNVWLGVSCEDQRRADERIPQLLATPAAVRWVSAEPMLGPIRFDRLTRYSEVSSDAYIDNALTGFRAHKQGGSHGAQLDWVVVGGESGRNARPMRPEWARSIRDQCAAAGVPFHFKQWGEWAPGVIERDKMFQVGKWKAGRMLDGNIHDGYPA